MGLLFTKLFDSFLKKKDCRILMLGLDAAGKTTILYQLKLGEVSQTVPTIGFNFESVEYKNLKFNVFDIGGQTQLRNLWRHYYQNCNALIYVLDSADNSRFKLAQETLHNLLDEEDLKGIPVLLYANKYDIANTSVHKIAEELEMNKLKDHKWKIQSSCALTRDGLYEGLEWLSKELNKMSF